MIREAFYNLAVMAIILITAVFFVPAGALTVSLIRDYNFDAIALILVLISSWLTLVAIPSLAGIFLKPYSERKRQWLTRSAVGAALISAATIVYISSIDQALVIAEIRRFFDGD